MNITSKIDRFFKDHSMIRQILDLHKSFQRDHPGESIKLSRASLETINPIPFASLSLPFSLLLTPSNLYLLEPGKQNLVGSGAYSRVKYAHSLLDRSRYVVKIIDEAEQAELAAMGGDEVLMYDQNTFEIEKTSLQIFNQYQDHMVRETMPGAHKFYLIEHEVPGVSFEKALSTYPNLRPLSHVDSCKMNTSHQEQFWYNARFYCQHLASLSSQILCAIENRLLVHDRLPHNTHVTEDGTTYSIDHGLNEFLSAEETIADQGHIYYDMLIHCLSDESECIHLLNLIAKNAFDRNTIAAVKSAKETLALLSKSAEEDIQEPLDALYQSLSESLQSIVNFVQETKIQAMHVDDVEQLTVGMRNLARR